jgi:hypothetical protein
MAGCGSPKKREFETASKIYIDNMLVDEKYAGNIDTIKFYRNLVFKKYNMKEDEYRKFFDELSLDRAKWDNFFKLAESYLDTLKAKETTK